MMVSNRNPLFQGSIFRGYVSFREGRFGMFCFQMIFSDYQNPRVSTGFNFRPAKIVDQKEADQSGKQSKRIAFQSHPFSGASMLVSGNVFTEWMFQKNDAFKNAFSAWSYGVIIIIIICQGGIGIGGEHSTSTPCHVKVRLWTYSGINIRIQNLQKNADTKTTKQRSLAKNAKLVGGWTNPFQKKYARQIGSFPQGSG